MNRLRCVSLLAVLAGLAMGSAAAEAVVLAPNHSSIAGDLDVWLAADRLNGSGALPADGASVATWEDLSGQNNDATQTTPGAQPIFKTGQIGPNARPVVRFNSVSDGTNDFMRFGQFLDYPNLTLFLVGKAAADPPVGDYQAFFSDYGTDGDELFIVQAWEGSTTSSKTMRTIVRDTDRDAIGLSALAGSDVTDYFLFTFRLDEPNDMTLRREMFPDGTFVQDTPSNAAYDSTTWQGTFGEPRMGVVSNNTGAGVLNGDIAELIIFDRKLTDDEYQGVEAYLRQKYFLPEPGAMAVWIGLLLLGVLGRRARRRR